MDKTVAVLKSWASCSTTNTATDQAFLVKLEALAARAGPLPAPPGDLVARGCRLSAARWHAECLRQLLQKTGCSPLRIACHAQWLLYALSGWDPLEAPLVSIIIPVFNRAEMAIEAVESCLRQTYVHYEIILVDDGSSDHLDKRIRPYVEQGLLTYAKKTNGGVSSARNMGISLARGHYLHFLDSDNLLNPDSLSRWMAAFTAIPDADLCYAPSEVLADSRIIRKSDANQAPTGRLDCPTNDLMRCVVRTHPFLTGGVMLSRWAAAEAGPFDETLHRSEDTLYWFRLALRGTKVAGLRGTNNRRRLNEENLSGVSLADHLPDLKQVRLISLTDLFQSPAQWVYTGRFLMSCFWPDGAFDWKGYGHPLWPDVLKRFVVSIRQLKKKGDKQGLSSRPLLELLAFHAFKTNPAACREQGDDPASQAVAEAVSQAWEDSAPLSQRDVDVWFYPEKGIMYPPDFPALRRILEEIDKRKASPSPVIRGSQVGHMQERIDAVRRVV